MLQVERNANFRSLLEQIESHNPSRKGHADRVAVYAVAIAEKMGIEDLMPVRLAATIHDAPKLQISQDILESKGPWSEVHFASLNKARDEFRLPFDDPDKDAIEEAIREQDMADGNQISRIIHVAVAFDSMTHAQPWRKHMTEEEAIALMRDIPSRFLPEAVSALAAVAPLIQPLKTAGEA